MADAETGVGQLDKSEQVVEIGQRLADAHHDDPAHALAGDSLRPKDLAGDFAGAQIADNATPGRGAEGAAHRTADLAGHAQRKPVAVTHQDRLNTLPVSEADQKLLGAVLRIALAPDHLTVIDHRGFGHAPPELFRQVGARVEGFGALFVQPLEQLLASEFRLSQILHQLLALI